MGYEIKVRVMLYAENTSDRISRDTKIQENYVLTLTLSSGSLSSILLEIQADILRTEFSLPHCLALRANNWWTIRTQRQVLILLSQLRPF